MKNIILSAVCLLVYGCVDQPRDVFEAVRRNDSSYAERYLKLGGDPNAVDRHGETLLYIATGPHGGMEVLSLLIDYKADPNQGTYTPLMNAASWGWLDGVKILISAGADPLLTNSEGKTARQCAAGDREVMDYLKRVEVAAESEPVSRGISL